MNNKIINNEYDFDMIGVEEFFERIHVEYLRKKLIQERKDKIKSILDE